MRKAIFVHGIFGWGESDPLWKIVPYWGLATGDLMAFLRKEGYDAAAASVGPISGTWDRACELYAELTGTRTDYGEAHSKRFGHKRFGRTYANALVPAWSEEHPIDLIGHSFGGTTSRLLVHLLSEGSLEEREASPNDVSPLFIGGKSSLVRTVCCISTPHNGATLFEAWPTYTEPMKRIGLSASKATGISNLKAIYDFKQEQFGFTKGENERLSAAIKRVAAVQMPKGDWAADDLRVDNALRMNSEIHMVPGVRYLSVAGVRTKRGPSSRKERPELLMTMSLWPESIAMGRYIDRKTDGGFLLDSSWAANDGLVNTVSARYPFTDPFVEISVGEPLKSGVWNVLPTENWDHLDAQGSANPFLKNRIHRFYQELMEMIQCHADPKDPAHAAGHL